MYKPFLEYFYSKILHEYYNTEYVQHKLNLLSVNFTCFCEGIKRSNQHGIQMILEIPILCESELSENTHSGAMF